MNLSISILYMFQAITEDAQQILDQMTEIENASKRNITPNTATCQISDYLTTSWPRCFITSLLSASKRLIIWKISTLIGLIELENTLILCTSEQTDFDIIKTIFLISHQNKNYTRKQTQKREWSLPTKLVRSNPNTIILSMCTLSYLQLAPYSYDSTHKSRQD